MGRERARERKKRKYGERETAKQREKKYTEKKQRGRIDDIIYDTVCICIISTLSESFLC